MSWLTPRWLRKYNGYTVEYVAALLDLDKSNYSRKERNLTQFSLREALRLAQLYRVPVEKVNWYTSD